MDDNTHELGKTAATTHMEFPAEIAKALVALQKKVKALAKTAENSHFKNTYAPLDEVMDNALPLLTEVGLALSQWPITVDGKHYLHSALLHEGGASAQSDIQLLLVKQDPQGLGSAITYTRRQTVMAILGLSAKDEDDDGNKASGNQAPATQEQLDEIAQLCQLLKFPKEEVEKKLRTVRTADRAELALAELEKIIATRASATRAAKATESAASKIDVSTEDDHSASLAAIANRLQALGLKNDTTIRELVRAKTSKPFLKNCKPADLEKLAAALDRIESGEEKLPGDWYAPTDEPKVVEEPTA